MSDKRPTTQDQAAMPMLTIPAPSMAMPVVTAPTLVILEATEQVLVGRRFTVNPGQEAVAGREPTTEICLPNERGVSRRHARFFLRGHLCLVEDLKSTNHTHVNDVKIEREQALSSGDRIRIGPVVMAFLAAEQPQRTGVNAVIDSLPYPVAALQPMVLAQDSAMARVRATLDALEMALRFISAVELAALRRSSDENNPEAQNALKEILRRKVPLDRPLSMGSWDALAWELARVMPRPTAASAAPIFEVAQAFIKKRGERSELSERVQSTVGYRNKAFGHGATLAEEAYAREEGWLRETLDRLILAACPLSRLRLVSVIKIDLVDGEDDAFRYTFRAHRGPLDRFPSSEVQSRARLRKEWCYLFDDAAGPDAEPLLLAPMVAARVAEQSGQVEIFLADGLAYGPKGAKMSGRGVVSSHTTSLVVPWGKSEEAFFAWLAA
jgi:hypothetical protein